MSLHTPSPGTSSSRGTLVSWSFALGLLIGALPVADYFARTRVLHEAASVRDIAADSLFALIGLGLISSCIFLRRARFAARVLLFSLAGATIVFLALTGLFCVAFVVSILGAGGGMWKFFVPAIAVTGLLGVWPFLLWRQWRAISSVVSAPTPSAA